MIRFFVVMLLALFFPLSVDAANSFAVYYSDRAAPEEFLKYDLVVLDSSAYPSVALLREKGKTVLGYLSLGEVEKNRPYFTEVKNAGLLIEKNKNWKDSSAVNIGHPLWIKKVVEELVPAILAKGYNGVFLDTLDTPVELERSDPEKWSGLTAASVALVKAIRTNFPHIVIMMNRGYAILPQLSSVIDAELGESVYTDYDFARKTYNLVPTSLYQNQVALLKAAKVQNPTLAIYTLDYWNRNDIKKIAFIYKTQRDNGFVPYVSTIGLDELVAEPLP